MENALILLTGSLFLALFIERLIEIIKAIYDVTELQTKKHNRWTELSKKIANQLYARLSEKSTESKYENFHLKLVSQYLFSEHPNYKGSMIVSTDKIRTIFIKYLSKLLGIMLGVIFAAISGINVFVLIAESTPNVQQAPALFTSDWLSGGLGIFMTGVFMGLGAGPMHKFIVALERARKKRVNTGLV